MSPQTLESSATRTSPRMAAGRTTLRPGFTSSPSYQAYRILHFGFVIAPLIAGADKFFHFLVDWTQYLAPIVPRTLNISAGTFMGIVGVVEIVAGLLVAFKPKIGGLIVAAWLLGIVANLFLVPGFYDIALRDFGLALGALALSRLASDYDVRA